MSNRKLTTAQLRKFRGDVAKLKAKGLVSSKVDARAQKPTRHMLNQVKRFDDVLTGRAQVVHTPKRSQAKAFAERFDVKGNSVVVPVPKRGKTGKLTYSAKHGEIHKTTRGPKGQRHTTTYRPNPMNVRDLPRGDNLHYQIEHGGTWTFDDISDLENFMRSAEHSGWKNWAEYVQVVSA